MSTILTEDEMSPPMKSTPNQLPSKEKWEAIRDQAIANSRMSADPCRISTVLEGNEENDPPDKRNAQGPEIGRVLRENAHDRHY